MREEQSAWRVLLSYVWPFRTALITGGVLSLATAATGLALPLVVRELIDTLRGGTTHHRRLVRRRSRTAW